MNGLQQLNILVAWGKKNALSGLAYSPLSQGQTDSGLGAHESSSGGEGLHTIGLEDPLHGCQPYGLRRSCGFCQSRGLGHWRRLTSWLTYWSSERFVCPFITGPTAIGLSDLNQDNAKVVAYINDQGGTRRLRLQKAADQILPLTFLPSQTHFSGGQSSDGLPQLIRSRLQRTVSSSSGASNAFQKVGDSGYGSPGTRVHFKLTKIL